MDAQLYYDGENPTITRYEKILYDMQGKAHRDMYTANHKIKSRFFQFAVDQENSYLLGNGVTLKKEANKKRLGKDFDQTLSDAAEYCLIDGVSFGFWNFDHLEAFRVTEFVPLYDEENGALMAGIRWWRVADDKPLRCTLYEVDGFTEYFQPKGGEMAVMQERRPYIVHSVTTGLDGTQIYDGENYPGFPIVPLRNNKACRSELCGGRNTIDAMDIVRSGMVNNVDEGSIIYWALTNCGGMSYEDAEKFLYTVKTTHVAFMDQAEDGAHAEPHTVEMPVVATQTAVDMLEKALYQDFQVINTGDESLNASTATGIKFRYAALDLKTDKFERQVIRFLHGIFALAGVDDEPTYTRNRIINTTEEMQTLMMMAPYVDDEYMTTKSLTLVGDGDRAEEILRRRDAEELGRFDGGGDEMPDEVSGDDEAEAG